MKREWCLQKTKMDELNERYTDWYDIVVSSVSFLGELYEFDLIYFEMHYFFEFFLND